MEMQFIKKVGKISGSYVVFIPKEVINVLNIEEGDYLVLKVVDTVKNEKKKQN